MRQKGLTPILAVLILAALGLFGFLVYKNGWINLSSTLKTKPLTISPNPSATPTVVWKTYTSANLGVAFSHPPYFEVNEYPSQPKGNMIFIQIDLNQFPKTNLSRPPRKQLSISKTSSKYNLDLSHMLKLKVGDTYKNPSDTMNEYVFRRLEDQIIDSVTFYVFEGYDEINTSVEKSKLFYTTTGDEYLEIVAANQNFDSNTSPEVPGREIDFITIFSQIISSIKFLK